MTDTRHTGPPTAPAAASQRAQGRLSDPHQTSSVHWELPVETPVALRINGEEYAVMLCTPQDLEDFARGFLLSEALVPQPDAIQAMHMLHLERGIRIDIQVRASALARQALKQRRLAGRSGCGCCGLQSLDDTLRPLPQLPARPPVPAATILRAFARLHEHQPIKQCNRSVHGAAWCDAQGEIHLSREDVGRHNALDKLIGALALQGREPTAGFAILSSRCSYELVQKAVSVGIGALATLSAPTSLALQLAQQAGLQLSAKCGDGIITFNPNTDPT